MNPLARPGSLLFAPMEGVTTVSYRRVIQRLYPQWDYLFADFLRIPSQQTYPLKHVKKHCGIYADENSEEQKQLASKTVLQILGPFHAYFAETMQQLSELELRWVDLNLGCPANTVNKRGGGSALLQDLKELEQLLKKIRKSFSGFFSVKTRLGYEDANQFDDLIKMYEAVGVDAITIHARTKRDHYNGVAKWDYIARAVELVKVPIVGNGDLWSVDDIHKMFQHTNCHSVMCARGAMMHPWLARDFYNPEKKAKKQEDQLRDIYKYFLSLEEEFSAHIHDEKIRYRIYKGLSRYIFDPLGDEGLDLKRKVLQGQQLPHFFDLLQAKIHCALE